MGDYTRLADLETLFLEKLQEKYKLNLRDVKKAFSRFDLDGNGLLDLHEMTQGIQLFLNGVKPAQVQKLVAKYDVNGDGKISYDEFLQLLQSRGATLEDDYSGAGGSGGGGGGSGDIDIGIDERFPPRPPSAGGYSDAGYSDAGANYQYSDAGGSENYDHFDTESPMGAPPAMQQHRSGRGRGARPVGGGGGGRGAMMYPPRPPSEQDELRSELSSAPSNASSNVTGTSGIEPGNPKDLEYRAKIFLSNLKKLLLDRAAKIRMEGKIKIPSNRHLDDLRETISRNLIMKTFQRYTGEGAGRAREQIEGVEAHHFVSELKRFKFPGTTPLRSEVARFIFDLCSLNPDGETFLNEEGRPVADPNILSDLLFGAPVHPEDRKARGLNRLGWKEKSNNERDTNGLEMKGFVDQWNKSRNPVARGPVHVAEPVDRPLQQQLEQMVVPLRFVSRKSKSALNVPSSFDPASGIAWSNQLPQYDLVRKHVFGMCGTLYSGSPIHVLPHTPEAFGADGSGVPRNSPDFIDPATLVYTSGGTGIVHNLATNSQLFFDGHEDDITCVTVSQDGSYAATGQMGKAPAIYVWPTNIPRSEAKRCIASIGRGFFARGVCALSISWDNKYILGVGCDDMHIMGVFEIITGKLLASSPTQHGIPPQIKWMAYCPAQQHTEFITREHAGLCDVFATAGANHLKMWSFRRPDDRTSQTASLVSMGLTVRKIGATAPKTYLCCAYIPCDDKTYDFVAGGSSGVVFLWRRGVVMAHVQACRGGVTSMMVCGDKIYCGGAGGVIKALDIRTLAVMQQFSLMESTSAGGPASNLAARKTRACTPSGGASRGAGRASVGGGGRASSAGPAARLASRQGSARGRAPVSSGAPKSTHAAGRANSRAHADSGAAAINGEGYALSKEQKEALEANAPPEETGMRAVTGIAAVRLPGSRTHASAAYLIATLGTGKVVRVDVSNNAGAIQRPGSARPASAGRSNSSGGGSGGGSAVVGRDLFHFHTGSVWGLAADVTSSSRIFATVCDHRKLMVWDAQDCVLLAKFALQNPGHCCAIDKTNSFIAVGSSSGSLTVLYLSDRVTRPTGGNSNSNLYKIDEVAYRKDFREETSDVKFSPSNDMIAIGSHDNTICVYGCELSTKEVGYGRDMWVNGVCVLRPLHRLRGHTSYITHLGWSYDSKLLRTTCGAYELICWNVETGRADQTVNTADVKWKTHHCVLGFNVMGIWPRYSDGTDINAVDVNISRGIVATGNDGSVVRLLNFPCVVENAPAKEYTGHSSHVLNVRFMRDGNHLMSVGGHDESVVVWEVVAQEPDPEDEFKKTTATVRRSTGGIGGGGGGTGGTGRGPVGYGRINSDRHPRRGGSTYENML